MFLLLLQLALQFYFIEIHRDNNLRRVAISTIALGFSFSLLRTLRANWRSAAGDGVKIMFAVIAFMAGIFAVRIYVNLSPTVAHFSGLKNSDIDLLLLLGLMQSASLLTLIFLMMHNERRRALQRAAEKLAHAMATAEAIAVAHSAAVLQVLPVGILVINTEGEIISYNERVKAILEVTDDGIRSGSLRERICFWPNGRTLTPDDFPGAVALRTGKPVTDCEFGCTPKPAI